MNGTDGILLQSADSALLFIVLDVSAIIIPKVDVIVINLNDG